MATLILAWKNPNTNEWIPIGKLEFDGKVYTFIYTRGVLKSKNEGFFVPLAPMQEVDKIYESDLLFPIFQNRLVQKSRPEYEDYLDWLNLDRNRYTPLEELSRSGGIRVTDNLQLFPIPQIRDGKYIVYFFSHGIRHLSPCYIERVSHLNHGNRLFLMADIQNNFDSFALALRTGDPPELVGYVPRFFSRDFDKLIKENGAKNAHVSVEKVNLKAPLQFKLLCKLSTSWPDNFSPFTDEEFKPIRE